MTLNAQRYLDWSKSIATIVILLFTIANQPSLSVAFVHHTKQSATFRTTLQNVNKGYMRSKPNGIRTSLSMVAKTGGKIIKTIDEFSKVVLAADVPRPVLVFFTAPWCGPCRLTIPVVKEIMKQFSSKIDVVEVCTDDLAEVASECGVVSIPTIQFYYGGSLYDTIIGCVAKGVLSGSVSAVLEDVKEQETLNNAQKQQSGSSKRNSPQQ